MTGGWIWVTCRGPNTLPESDVGAVHAKYAGWFKYLFLHTRRNSKCHCMMAAELGHEARSSPEEGAGDATPLGTMSPRDGDEEETLADLSPTMALLMLWL